MSYYFEKTNSYMSEPRVKNVLGSDILDRPKNIQQSYGLFDAHLLEYDFNHYSQEMDSYGTVTWTKYTNDSDLLASNPNVKEEYLGLDYPAYFGERSTVNLTGAELDISVSVAKRIVFEEVADRISKVVGASLALRINALSLSDSSSTMSSYLAASDSEILDLAYSLSGDDFAQLDSDWPTFDVSYLGTTGVVSDVTAGPNLDFTGLPTSDPAVAGKLWRDSDIVKVSLG